MSDADTRVIERVLPPTVRDFIWAGLLDGLPRYIGWVDRSPQQDRFIAKRLCALEVPCYVELLFWKGPEHGETVITAPADADTQFMITEINRAARVEGYAFRAEAAHGCVKLRPIYLDEI